MAMQRLLVWLAVALGVAALGWLVWWLSAVFVPLAIGLLLAFVLAPTVESLGPRLGSRGRAAGLLLGSGFLALTLTLVGSVPLLTNEVQHWIAAVRGEGNPAIAPDLKAFVDYGDFADPDLEVWDAALLAADASRRKAPTAVVKALAAAQPAASAGEVELADALGDRDADGRLDPGYVRRVQLLAKNRSSTLGSWLANLERSPAVKEAVRAIEQAGSRSEIKKLLAGGKALSTAGDVGKRVWETVQALLATATTLTLGALLVPVYAFLLLMALPRWRERFPLYLPASERETWLRILRRIRDAISAFVRGRLVVCAIVGVVTAIGWALLGVRLGLLAGLAVGALTLVPLANVLVLVPVVVMSLLDVASDVHGWGWFAGMLVIYGVGQLAESILNPLIVGDAVQLDTLTMLLALFAGGAVGGFLGLLLAVPVAATLKILADELLLPRWRDWAASR